MAQTVFAWMVRQQGDHSGFSVSAAGDVNGDGFDDLIIGAYNADSNSIGDEGASYVIYGATNLAGVTSAIVTHEGTNGNDTLVGTDGGDIMIGGRGDDTFTLGAGNDVAKGGEGNDTFHPGTGTDRINGGTGIDELDFSGSTSGVTVNLRYGKGSLGDASGDFYDEVEDIVGTDFNDALIGDNKANFLHGHGGDDTLYGGAGNDRITGGEGGDIIRGDAGADILSGGAGNDWLIGESITGGSNPAEIDVLYGGVGNDTYYVNSTVDALDIVYESGAFAGGASDVDTITSTGTFFWDFYDVGEILTILQAAGGDTRFVSGRGDSTMYGNDFANILIAYGGSNEVNPGKGIDAISFGLFGLAASFNGVNTAKIRPGDDVNYIYDFESGIDKIDTSAYGRFTDGAQMLANVADTPWGSMVWMGMHEGEDEFIGFMGLNKADLDAGDFLV